MSEHPTVFDYLLEVTTLLQEDLEHSFAGTDLTPSRTHLLWVLHHGGPSTQRALAEALDVSARAVSGLVDVLESTGYVERRAHATDRRALQVSLTDRGADAMTAMAAQHAEAAERLIEGMDASAVAELTRGLEHVIGRLRRMVEESRS